MKKKVFIYADGGARGNPGPAAIGVVVKTETGKMLATISRKIGETTNNVAEYRAVLSALTWLKENKNIVSQQNVSRIQFFLDSTLVANQLNGIFKVKDGKLREFLLAARILESEIGLDIHYQYVPREKNFEADFLVNQAFDNQSHF